MAIIDDLVDDRSLALRDAFSLFAVLPLIIAVDSKTGDSFPADPPVNEDLLRRLHLHRRFASPAGLHDARPGILNWINKAADSDVKYTRDYTNKPWSADLQSIGRLVSAGTPSATADQLDGLQGLAMK